MFQKGELTELEVARRELALEADLRRRALQLEALELQKRIRNAQSAYFAGPFLKPALMLGSVIVGAFAGRRKMKLSPWLPAGLALLRFLRRKL